MWIDSFVDEVRKHREAHAEAFDYNVAEIYRDLQRQQVESGRRVVSLPARRVELSQASLQAVEDAAAGKGLGSGSVTH